MYRKGESGNKSGRPLGSVNLVTSKARSLFEGLLDENIDQLREDLKSMTPVQRAGIILKLAEFIIPKANAGIDISIEYRELEKLLKKTPSEFIERLEQKLIYLNTKSKNDE